MRKRFEVQLEIGAKTIESIKIPKSRDELPPVIRALQYIYVTPEINEKVFALLESRIRPVQNGRPGLSLWEILVLAVVRLTLDANYDRLEDLVNHHSLIRDLLGVNSYGMEDKKYPYQTIRDNASLLDEELIDEINEIVVKEGQALKKKADEELEVKIDSYVLESNVHFPTDINLLWDSARKCLDIVDKLVQKGDIPDWRKAKDWRRKIKYAYNQSNRVSFRGGANKTERLFQAVSFYLEKAKQLSKKIKETKPMFLRSNSGTVRGIILLEALEYYEQMLDKHIDLLQRRIIYGEKIPHAEKIFSIFEPYTEWIKKGKAGNRVELGLKVAVCSDQFSFILRHRILEHEQDVDSAIPIAENLLSKWPINSLSYDKGYWSKENYRILSLRVKYLIMPKKGKCNLKEKVRETDPEFIRRRHRHSAIESNINSLEHHGLNRCPDRGLRNFKRYVALGILSQNLHLLGNILVAEDREREKKRQRQAA